MWVMWSKSFAVADQLWLGLLEPPTLSLSVSPSLHCSSKKQHKAGILDLDKHSFMSLIFHWEHMRTGSLNWGNDGHRTAVIRYTWNNANVPFNKGDKRGTEATVLTSGQSIKVILRRQTWLRGAGKNTPPRIRNNNHISIYFYRQQLQEWQGRHIETWIITVRFVHCRMLENRLQDLKPMRIFLGIYWRSVSHTDKGHAGIVALWGRAMSVASQQPL